MEVKSNRVKVADPVVSGVGGVLALVAKFTNWFSFFLLLLVCLFFVFLESRNFFNILNWTHILRWNVFGVHSDGQSSLLNSFVPVKFLSLSKLVMCKGVQTKKSSWCRVRLFTAQNGRLEWVGGGDRDYSCWQTPLPRTPACFGCASFGFSFACTLLVFSFTCANSERLWTVSCWVCMFLRRVTEFATHFKNLWICPCCNPWKLQWQVAGAPNGSFR